MGPPIFLYVYKTCKKFNIYTNEEKYYILKLVLLGPFVGLSSYVMSEDEKVLLWKRKKKNGKSFKLKDEKQKQTNKGSGFKGI